jgi:hypothetical protein
MKTQGNGQHSSDSRGVVHKGFVPPRVTVNHKYYLEVVDRPRKRVMGILMEIADDWILRVSSRQRARKHGTVSSQICGEKLHSFTSVGSLFCVFFTLLFSLVPKIKIERQGLLFLTLDSVKEVATDAIKTQTDADFQSRFEAWNIRWANCVTSEGCYFEGDNVDLYQ